MNALIYIKGIIRYFKPNGDSFFFFCLSRKQLNEKYLYISKSDSQRSKAKHLFHSVPTPVTPPSPLTPTTDDPFSPLKAKAKQTIPPPAPPRNQFTVIHPSLWHLCTDLQYVQSLRGPITTNPS